jgi:hypothetical protein
MRRISAGVVALALAVPVSGQEARPVAKTDRDTAVVISGCLEGGRSSYTLSTRGAGRIAHEGAGVPVGTSGASISYRLTPRDGVNLARHVGRRVEIRGALLPAQRSDERTTPANDEPKRDDSPDVKDDSSGTVDPADALVRPNVAVTAIRVLSGACR